jgi:hypothetical protein
VYLILFIWIGVVLVFFSFGQTQVYYTFPCLGAFALLIGKSIAELEAGSSWKSTWIGLGITAAVGILIGAGLAALTVVGKQAAQTSTLSQTLTVNPDYYYVQFGHLFDLTPATFSILAPLVCTAAALLAAGPAIAFFFALRRRLAICLVVLTIMMIGVCHTYKAGMIAFESVVGSKGLADVIQQNYQAGDKIVINDLYEEGSSLNYYTDRQVYVMNGQFGVLWYGLLDKTAPKLWLSEDELLDEWSRGDRIFLFSEGASLRSFLSRHPDFKYRVLAEQGGKRILVNW